MNPTLDLLIAGTATGDDDARRALGRRLVPMVDDVLLRLAGRMSGADKDDLLGQVILWLYGDLPKHCRRYDPARSNPTTYFRNVVIPAYVKRYWRDASALKRAMALTDDAPERHPDPGGSAPQLLEAHERAELLERWGQRLDEPGRTIFFEHMLGDTSGPEMAARLGLRTDALYKRVQRLKEELASHLLPLLREGAVASLLAIAWLWFSP